MFIWPEQNPVYIKALTLCFALLIYTCTFQKYKKVNSNGAHTHTQSDQNKQFAERSVYIRIMWKFMFYTTNLWGPQKCNTFFINDIFLDEIKV